MEENATNVSDVNNLKGGNDEESDSISKQTERNNRLNSDKKTDYNDQTKETGFSIDDHPEPMRVHDLASVDSTRKFELSDDDHNSHRCGIFSFSPDWLQAFTSKKSFVLFYGVLGMSQFALSTYFVATISTIEKRFKMPTRTSDMGKSLCGKLGASTEHCEDNLQSIIVAFIFIVSQILNGLGCSTYWSLGFTYLDDNVRKDKVALLIAICSFMRSFGPMVGFFISWIALDMYIVPSLKPSIGPSDPRWIGAWWYGWAPLGIMMILFGISIAFFPRMLPRAAARQRQADNAITQRILDTNMKIPEAAALIIKEAVKKEEIIQERTLKDLFKNIRRILKNKLFVLNVIASLCYMFGMMGYWAYLPKYMETQFHVSASKANIVSGAVGLVFSGIGLLASGAAITFFKPRARFLAGWNTFVEIIDAIGHYMYALIGCPDGASSFHGSLTDDFKWNMTDSCNADCSCSSAIKYDPVCQISKNLTFFSPCHAGCSYTEYNGTSKIFMNCSCADNGPVVPGFCPVDCYEQFMVFVIVMSFLRLLSSTSRSSSSIIMIRCVSIADKSISIGILEMGLILFAFLPAPIIYGLILDNVCLVWGETCGETGNCWLYDAEKMRYYLNFTSSTFLLLAAFADLGVYFLSKDLKIYDEEIEEETQKKKKKKKKDPEDGLEFDEMSKEAQLLILRAVQSPVAVKKSDIAPEE
ncbi:solute carrier organic anion transporter family member 74D isoform X2 [Nilaparvata lugens]|uniref:solute carrier organic anion transporter family member 74D isoform X2 n=1 Tax=Nilaparvata lugens TaxID=108931 RepID=UPI00193DFF60|nr:solute carrier organic anion transporter family member 74D isoform X2 [Nilaparvata lugens]